METLVQSQPETLRAYRYHIPEIVVREVGESLVAKEGAILSRAELVADFFRAGIMSREWFDKEKEHFVVLLLNRKNRLKSYNLVTIGTATAALAHPREVFRAAVVASACAIICVHNHPSGDPVPSSADLHITHLLREAAKTLEITLLDHVVIGSKEFDPQGKGFYSFRDSGLI